MSHKCTHLIHTITHITHKCTHIVISRTQVRANTGLLTQNVVLVKAGLSTAGLTPYEELPPPPAQPTLLYYNVSGRGIPFNVTGNISGFGFPFNVSGIDFPFNISGFGFPFNISAINGAYIIVLGIEISFISTFTLTLTPPFLFVHQQTHVHINTNAHIYTSTHIHTHIHTYTRNTGSVVRVQGEVRGETLLYNVTGPTATLYEAVRYYMHSYCILKNFFLSFYLCSYMCQSWLCICVHTVPQHRIASI